MKTSGRVSYLVSVASLLLVTIGASPVALRAQSRTTARPLNQINPAFVITPREATEWHALKAKGGPAFSGNPSWRNFMEFVETKLKDYGAVDVTRNAFTYDRWHTSEWPDDGKWSLLSNGKKVRVASYGAYSGSTSEEGVTAEMVYYDAANPPKDIAGKIVVWQPRFTRQMQEGIYANDYEYPGVEDSWPVSGKPVPTGLDNKVAGSIIWSQLPQVAAFIRTSQGRKSRGRGFCLRRELWIDGGDVHLWLSATLQRPVALSRSRSRKTSDRRRKTKREGHDTIAGGNHADRNVAVDQLSSRQELRHAAR